MTTFKLAVTASVACAIAFLPAIVGATPGQTIAQFTSWAKANPALHDLAKKKSDMSGLPYYTATFRAGSTAGNLLASVGGTDSSTIVDESVAVQTPSNTYDILKHLDIAGLLLRTVYGSPVADDFAAAQKVGTWTLLGEQQPTALYRGKLYGYEAAFHWVKLIPLTSVTQAATDLANCVKNECGD